MHEANASNPYVLLFPADGTPFASEAFKGWERYEVGPLLGEGGMGQVYKAFARRLKRPVALKVLRVQDDELLKRFINGAQTQARVDHPNVCRVYEVGMSYAGRSYAEGKKITRKDGVSAIRCIIKYNLFR